MDLTVVSLGRLLVSHLAVSHLSQPVIAGTQIVIAITQTVIAGLIMLAWRGVLERRAELIN